MAYATEFENNCRKLAHLTELDTTEPDFSLIVYLAMQKGTLYQKINRLVDSHSLPQHVDKIIHNARNARNYIAHSIASEHRTILQTKDGRNYFRAEVHGQIDDIIKGNQCVLDITRIITNGEVEDHGSDVVEYHFAVGKWIDG